MRFVALLVLVMLAAAVAAEEFKCEPNVPYIENNCNGCFCGPNGHLACTQKACIGADQARLHGCEVGSTYEKDCNKCWCVKDVGTVCTNKSC